MRKELLLVSGLLIGSMAFAIDPAEIDSLINLKGVVVSANKIHGIRACCCSDAFSAEYTRRHNDANALCLGGRVVGAGLACTLVDLFLNTEFEGGRHQRRVDKITALENR